MSDAPSPAPPATGSQELDALGTAFLFVIALAAIVAAVVAAGVVAALTDPFSALPTLGQLFGDCAPGTPEEACGLTDRFPGLWWKAAGSTTYVLITAAFAVAYLSEMAALRRARGARHDGAEGAEAYTAPRDGATVWGVLLVLCTVPPLLVAIL